MISDLNGRVQQAKENVNKVKAILEPFATQPLYERKEKQDNLLGLTDRVDLMKKRINALTMAGIEIHDLMQVSCSFINIKLCFFLFTPLSVCIIHFKDLYLLIA